MDLNEKFKNQATINEGVAKILGLLMNEVEDLKKEIKKLKVHHKPKTRQKK